LGIDPKYLAVSVFAGDDSSLRDEESADLWQKVGISKDKIAYLDKQENWWPAGGGDIGPQGPDTEIFYWTGEDAPPKEFDASDEKWVEIWNDVFMEYNGTGKGKLEKLKQQNVDTGMGLERVVMVLNGLESIYEIDTCKELKKLIKSNAQNYDERRARIVIDHIKAATFVLSDENRVEPSKTEQGYVLRRLIRRAVYYGRTLGYIKPSDIMIKGMKIVVKEYGDVYPTLRKYQTEAEKVLRDEIEQFNSVIEKGLQRMDNYIAPKQISGKDIFELHTTYGFPRELTEELIEQHGIEIVNPEVYEKEFAAHRELSRKAAKGKFAGGLADQSDESVNYHTATHLLHQALREVLGDHVEQKGSNITTERLRFDFSHSEKMTEEEIKKVEEIVNEKIKDNLSVVKEEMGVEEAKKKGALGLFEKKYGDKVSVYFIGDFSNEICGGPHVEKTGVLGTLSIIKEESSSGGVRRIKAVLKDK
jgi:alanyl-tRNA synthetase